MKHFEILAPIIGYQPGTDPPEKIKRGGAADDPLRDQPDDPWSVLRWHKQGLAATQALNETHKGRKLSLHLDDWLAECEASRKARTPTHPQVHVVDGRVFLAMDNDEAALCTAAVSGTIPGIAFVLLKQMMPFEESFMAPLDALPKPAPKAKPERKPRAKNGVKKPPKKRARARA